VGRAKQAGSPAFFARVALREPEFPNSRSLFPFPLSRSNSPLPAAQQIESMLHRNN
jgi:hypothetical protein